MPDRDSQAYVEFRGLVGVDKTVHEPARLAILTALSACASADYVFLQRLTGLVSGSLTQHLARLEDAGRQAHWERMAEARDAAARWRTAEQT